MERFILKLKDIDSIPPTPEGLADIGNGVNSFIYRGEHLAEIQDKFGRTGCCLKIFKNREKFKADPSLKWWGDSHPIKGSRLNEATHIQNIFAYHGLAPRVYALIIVKIKDTRYWAQLTDDLGTQWGTEEEQQMIIKGKIKEIADKYNITIFDDGRETNIMQGKYIDFQGFHLPENYEEELKQRLIGVANVGKWGPWMNYHSVKKLGIQGGRNNKQRIKEMKLNKIDFENKTVLDIGCSEGFFCNYAANKGAKRVIGIDLPGVVEPVQELSSYEGYYNTDYIGGDLSNVIYSDMADIIFFFSMVQHIGMPEWLHGATAELLVFEGNGKDRDREGFKYLTDNFTRVDEIGKTTDLFERTVLWARR